MEFHNHAYTCTTYNDVRPLEFIYKMLNLKQMGLQHKMTHSQASKKWENLKKRYKELKNPPDGVKAFPEAWPHFTLMDDAIKGRLVGSAPILEASPSPFSRAKRSWLSMVMTSPAISVADGMEIEDSLNGEEEEEREGSRNINCIMRGVEDERNVMNGERQAMEREKQLTERERLVLQREKAALDRDVTTLERDRASLERERATLEREKAVLERERAMVETDREAVSRDRLSLECEKARMKRLCAPKATTEEVAEQSGNVNDTHVMDMDRKERFLYLFEKLIESV
ncbi:putative caldesmon-like [Scophthalmus maximus]|uniref:Putative caldesmon-like n=1 Tax=Scophthalmus maximus TaxID=52904 RepID=A0A2U9B2J7_SCOMX|nr:putative caldesmon-like [Scophthalmus maximus]